jgi:hypothetical protein
VQAQRQRAQSSLQHPKLKTIRPHRARSHCHRRNHAAKLPPSAPPEPETMPVPRSPRQMRAFPRKVAMDTFAGRPTAQWSNSRDRHPASEGPATAYLPAVLLAERNMAPKAPPRADLDDQHGCRRSVMRKHAGQRIGLRCFPIVRPHKNCPRRVAGEFLHCRIADFGWHDAGSAGRCRETGHLWAFRSRSVLPFGSFAIG